MKPKFAILSALSLLAAAPVTFAADGALKEQARTLSAAHKDSVLFLSAVVDLEVTAGDKPAKKEERKIEMIGTVIGKDSLIVVPLSTLDIAATIDGRMMNTPQGPLKLAAKGTTKEVKILMPDGSETLAEVVFKDVDLDLAFIRPEKPEEAKLSGIEITNSAPMEMMDDVIILGRLAKDLNRDPVAMTSEVISLITKPRLFGKLATQALGMPVFNKDGKFLGIGINRFSPKGETEQGPMPSNVILPAADLQESAAQVKK
jgi:hypothetical protein